MLKKAKKPLTPLQKLKQQSKPKRETIPHLTHRADAAFSRYVRLRDSSYNPKHLAWTTECISCGRKMVTVSQDYNGVWRWQPSVNAGHYITRGHKGLRFDEGNVNAQCARCNAWADKVWMITNYRKNLCLKIGDEGVEDLEARSRLTEKLTRAELEEVIRVSKAYVEYTLAHPEGVASQLAV